jgi:pimeloyl-ACP methyl ester carboxylesterase
LKKIHIATDRGEFTAQVFGLHGEWVVCWPGQLNDHDAFSYFASILARDFRVVVCDLPAFGLNRDLPYTHSVNEHVYYAHRLLTKLGIDHCHWVGFGGGGVIGAALHSAMPSQLRSLTLASTPMLSQSRLKLHAAVTTSLLGRSRLGRRLLASFFAQELGYASRQEKALLTNYFQQAFERAHPKAISSLRPLDGASVRRAFDRLRANQPPMLILSGKHDGIVLPRDQRTVAEITQSHIAYLDTGHMTLLVEPETCAHAFQRFVQGFAA